jgi:DNA-binding response OmpR family regulator
MKHRILVVAEDASVRATLARWLMAASYAVELAESPKRAREVMESETVALAIADPQGLGSAGRDLARELRAAIGRLIVVTEPSADAGSQTVTTIESDGLISKPLNEAEVLEKVKAALPAQPKGDPPSDILYFERHILDVGARQCRTLDGKDIPLTRGEFTLLSVLARQNGRVVSRDELRQAVAGRDAGPDDRSVDVLISRMRRKIEPDPKQPRIIVTVPGEGYRLATVAQSQDRRVPIVTRPPPVASGR